MDDNKRCWDKSANKYDFIMKKDAKGYERIYEIISNNIKGMNVLEIGTGTGLIARNTAQNALEYTATDFSSEMIKKAKEKNSVNNINYEIANAIDLEYDDEKYDAVIISNCLHIMPYPEKALREIKRVLKQDGILLAPNFCHKGSLKAAWLPVFSILTGFKTYNSWYPKEYLQFIRDNGFAITQHETIKASFIIEMVIAKKNN